MAGGSFVLRAVFMRNLALIFSISIPVYFISPIRSLCPLRLLSSVREVGSVPNTIVVGIMRSGRIVSFSALITLRSVTLGSL